LTIVELKKLFNESNELPKTYEVDAETYANVCQSIFNNLWEFTEYWSERGIRRIDLSLGPNKGIMFKNVELILK